MQLPATGSYQITRPTEIPAVNWDVADSAGGFSSSSIKADWESGDYHRIHGYVQLRAITSGSVYSSLAIQQRIEEFAFEASHSGYNMSGSLLWKDNTAYHPFR